MLNYSHEVENMCVVAKGPKHGPAPIPEEGKWVKAYQIGDISGLSHGIGWCAPQQGMCKLTLNVKEGVIEEALVETSGCSGMTHSAAWRPRFCRAKRFSRRSTPTSYVTPSTSRCARSSFSSSTAARRRPSPRTACPSAPRSRISARAWRSQIGTIFATKAKGVRYLEMAEGYILSLGLDADGEVIGYKFVHLGKMMDMIKNGVNAQEAFEKNTNTYGRYADAVKYIDPRKE